MTAIPIGSKVRFLRPEHSVEHYEAKVLNSHRLSDFESHHYEIDCKGFPYIIGFAHDDELFTSIEAANEASKVHKNAAVERKRKMLLSEKARIDSELEALAA